MECQEASTCMMCGWSDWEALLKREGEFSSKGDHGLSNY